MNQPLAYVHSDAKIAKNVVIEPFTTIDKNVVIGEGTWIGPNVTIMEGARIGKNCNIFPGSVISAVPQDLKFNGEKTTAEIGDNTTIRECVTINRGTTSRAKTKIGKHCLIMAYSHIAHDCIVGDYCIFFKQQYTCRAYFCRQSRYFSWNDSRTPVLFHWRSRLCSRWFVGT